MGRRSVVAVAVAAMAQRDHQAGDGSTDGGGNQCRLEGMFRDVVLAHAGVLAHVTLGRRRAVRHAGAQVLHRAARAFQRFGSQAAGAFQGIRFVHVGFLSCWVWDA
jgi:hypothetical protein